MPRLREGVDVVVAQLVDRNEPSLLKRVLVSMPVVTVAPVIRCPAKDELEAAEPNWNNVPLILPAAGSIRRDVEAWLRGLRVTPDVYSEVPGNEAIISLVALGCGVGFVPRLVMDKSPLAADIEVVAGGPQLTDFQVGFCTLRKAMAEKPEIQALWDSITDLI